MLIVVFFCSFCFTGGIAQNSESTGSKHEQEQATDVQQSKQKEIVIVTGMDHPAHNWKKTAPYLKKILEDRKYVTVEIKRSPEFLGSSSLQAYDSVVMHWMNWKQDGPGPEAQGNLDRFVRSGGGMVVVHFACGAFHGSWEEGYEKLAGRIWDPEKPSHDPYGTFQVTVKNNSHPITRGLSSFQTTDELYTCLSGEPSINVLATARSSVTDEPEPMAFTLSPGDGRVFHTALGHDVKSMKSDGFQTLIRRATTWVSGRSPKPIRSPEKK